MPSTRSMAKNNRFYSPTSQIMRNALKFAYKGYQAYAKSRQDKKTEKKKSRYNITTYATLGGRYGPKRFKKNTSKSYKKAKQLNLTDGYSGCFETSGNFSEVGQSIIIGHTTHPLWELVKSTICNMYAQLFNRIHRPVQRWSDTHSQPNTWGINFQYTDDLGNERTVQAYFGAFPETHYDYCSRLLNAIVTEMLVHPCSGGSINLMQFFTSAGVQLEGALLLRGAMVTSMGKSSLKVQNRTVAAVGDDEADVNNQPLTGRIYEREGGFIQFRDKQNQLKSNSSHGRILEFSSSINWLQEPVDNYVVSGKGSSVPIRLDPGKIKTSTLTKVIKISLDRLFNELSKIADQFTGQFGNTAVANIYGRTRFMQMERVIDVGEVPIIGAYEIDSKLYTKVNCRKYRINRYYQNYKY